MKLIINDLDKLSIEERQELQDYISGITTNFEIEYNLDCDICLKKVYFLNKYDTKDMGIINICNNCLIKINLLKYHKKTYLKIKNE